MTSPDGSPIDLEAAARVAVPGRRSERLSVESGRCLSFLDGPHSNPCAGLLFGIAGVPSEVEVHADVDP